MNVLEQLESRLKEAGYLPRRSDVLALASALAAKVQHGGSKALLVQGPPGTGKSAFASAIASVIQAQFVMYQCHSWTDADELFVGVDVQAAVAGNAESVRQEGVLARVARLSAVGMVVLLLDELDKAQDRAEALLLDWLQSGRVPLRPGIHAQTEMNNVIVIITSNDERQLSEALLRRAARLVMGPLPVEHQIALIRARTGMDKGMITMLWKLAREVAAAEGNNALSIQEGCRLTEAAFSFAQSKGDLQILVAQWAARSNKGRAAIPNMNKQVSAAWAEVCRARKGQSDAA